MDVEAEILNSRNNEFSPAPITYNTRALISVKELFEGIQAFYNQNLVQADRDLYEFLLDDSRPSLRDVMIELTAIRGLTPYFDGYRFNLES